MLLQMLPDAEAVAIRAVDVIVTEAKEAIGRNGVFTLAVSGGRTPRRMLELLAERPDLDWSAVHLFQVDERVAPDGDPDRNATMLADALLGRVAPAGVHRMPVVADDLHAAAAEYAGSLALATGVSGQLDLVQLGLGADGHTASLLPDDPVLDVTDAVGVTEPYQGRRRMTITYPVIAKARTVLWVITGAEKQPALAQLLASDATIPAGRVGLDRSTVLADDAALGH